jgi:hypothetical protein
MSDCPLLDIKGLKPKDIQRTATGWRLPAKNGISATLRNSRHSLICRVAQGSDTEVVQLGIGNATSLLCNAVFNPTTDEALVFRGESLKLGKEGEVRISTTGPLVITRIRDYMKVHRNLPWYKPMDRSRFPRQPAGWCSWYCYWLGINEAEVVRNTDWIAKNLRQFGCEWVQIDDGWQGSGWGYGTNRNWFVTCDKFPKGMKYCADYIRDKGLKPGIWCIPFTQSDTKLFKKHPKMFVRRKDGSSAGENKEPLDYKWMPESERRFNWAGRYILDASNKETQEYIKKLARMLCDEWGYDYVKADAQSFMVGLYEANRAQLSDPSLDPELVYRKALEAFKSVVGPDRFLLNCTSGWPSVGLCEGIRIGDDVWPRWEGIDRAASCTLKWLWLNTLAFYTDPDVICVRDQLPYDHAHVWTVLLGITGQLLMESDKVYELQDERVELLRRIFPVADIHPMEIYPLDDKNKPGIFDLKVNLPKVGTWDVVALFNWDRGESKKFTLTAKQLGLEEGKYLWQDTARATLIQPDKDGKVTLDIAPASCRVVSVWPMLARPMFMGTSRHLTRGAVDVAAVNWDQKSLTLSGTSDVVGKDAYRIYIHVPAGYRIKQADGVEQSGKTAILTIQSDENRRLNWQIGFERTKKR